jgi:hypothetical protein
MPILVILFACHIEKKSKQTNKEFIPIVCKKKKKLKRRDLIKRDYT